MNTQPITADYGDYICDSPYEICPECDEMMVPDVTHETTADHKRIARYACSICGAEWEEE